MEKIINHSLGTEKAIKLCKKALSGKMAILSTENPFKVGTPPMMTALIEVTDTTISIKAKGFGEMIAETAANEIELAISDLNESNDGEQPNSNNAPTSSSGTITAEQYLEYQQKAVELLKQFKSLLDGGVLTAEEFETKKADLLNFINGMM